MTNTNTERKSSNKRRLIAAVLLAVALLIMIGIAAAYYSDVIQNVCEVTTNTLNIEGEFLVYLNGTSTTLENITGLTPGDVIVIKGTITNTGNQSAWIREKVSFNAQDSSIYDYFEVYKTELTQADFVPDYNFTSNLFGAFVNGVAVSSNRVINGMGTDARSEGIGSYNYLDATSYNFTLTIYFKLSAPNATQGKAVSIGISTEAVQFKNNNAAEPTEQVWAVVAAA